MKNETNILGGPSFSLMNRMGRVLWSIAVLLLFRYTPKPMHAWRAMVLKLFGAKVGKGARVYPGVIIWAPWNVSFGEGCGVGNGVNIYSQGEISIGKMAVISQGSYLCGGTHDYTNPAFPLYTKPIHIGDHVWIAAEAFVHPGVTIGEGCVIGARSVVTTNMPAWMVCSGFPCEPLKKREMIKENPGR